MVDSTRKENHCLLKLLHVNTSFVTAVANDYGYDHVYSRMVEAAGKKLDILIGISTSGNSKNVVNAILKKA